MNNLISRFQKADPASLWLITGIGLILIPHFAYHNLAIMACCVVLLLWRLIYELGYVPLPRKWLRTLLAFCAFASVAMLYQTVFGRNAGVALLLLMLCLKLLETTSRRDFAVTVCLGYFVVVTGFLYSQSILVAIYMFLAIVVLTTSFITFNRIKTHFLQDTNIRLAGVMLLQALPLALLLFMLFPRIPGPLWGLPKDAFDAKTGLSDSMSPGRISSLSSNEAVAFRVEFESDVPPPPKLYWRGPVFTHFDGSSWSGKKQILFVGGSRVEHVQPQLRTNSNPYTYNVILEPHNKHWLLALDLPTTYPNNAALTSNYELTTAQPVKKLIRYEIESHVDYRLQASGLNNRHTYLQLPSNIGIKAQQLMIQLITSLSGQEDRDEKIVKATLNYFKQQPFIYTKKPPLLSTDPIDEFLFGSRRGFCEHYASAFTYLMRAAGIPARVVTGYQGGELNTMGEYVVVRQSDAHAWSEVWIKKQGWVRIDPTSVIPAERVEHTEHLERFRPTLSISTVNINWLESAWKKIKFGMDNINHYWNLWILGYNSKLQLSFMSWLGLGGLGWQGITILLFVGLFLTVGYFAIQLLYFTRAKKDAAQKIYGKFCRKLKRLGINKAPNEGAKAFAERASNARPDLADAITHITLLYNSIRYARQKHTITELRSAVNAFKP